MKNLKTTIKLSVLALACLGAGALALQPTATAQAEETPDYASCLTMVNGAAVCVKDGFSGIRWETKIDASKYTEGATFGTLVMPTGTFGDELNEEDIKEDGTGALDLPAVKEADKEAFYSNLPDKFYTVVDYSDLATDENLTPEQKQAILKNAYEKELTARSYVKVNGEYYFTEESASRSAKNVALSAELLGELGKMDDDKAAKAAAYYTTGTNYGRKELADGEKNTGAVGTAVIDLSATEAQPVAVAFEGLDPEKIQQVMVGAEVVDDDDYNYANSTLTLNIAPGEKLPTGEVYVTVLTDDGIYTQPVICATMVITNTEGLKIFNAKGVEGTFSTKVTEKADLDGDGAKESHNYYNEGYWSADQEQSGYYVLGGNVEAIGYVHGSKNKDGTFNNSTWNGAKSYIDKPIGLTGTFNGMGYSINNMEMGSAREGLFGIVNDGTVKNVAFMDVRAKYSKDSIKYIIANYLINATIENVYITTEEYEKGSTTGFPAYYAAVFGEYAYVAGENKETVIRNCNIVFNTNNKAQTDGDNSLLFRVHNSGTLAAKFENVHVASGNNYNYYYKDASGADVKENVRQRLMYLAEDKIVYLAENEVVQDGVDEDGNPVWKPTAATATPAGTGIYPVANFVQNKGLTYYVLTGVYRYKNLTTLKTIEAAVAWMPAAWLA